MPAPRDPPSREEVIAYIQQVAAQYGIDPEIFTRIVQGESDFDPAARGDINKKTGKPESVGLPQLFRGGLLPDFAAKTGLDAADPQNWRQTIDYMAQHAVETQGQHGGWDPWHAAKRANIAQYEGLPQGQATGRKGRTSETAQAAVSMVPPMFIPGQQNADRSGEFAPDQPVPASSFDDLIKGWQENKLQYEKERGPTSIGQALLGPMFDNVPGEKGYREDKTLAGGIFNMFRDDKEDEKLLADIKKKTNPYAPGSVESQYANAPKKNPGYTLANALFGTEPPAKKQNLLGGIMNFFAT